MSKRLEVFQGADGWRWRLVAGNNEKIATSGEAFSSKFNAQRAAHQLDLDVPISVEHTDDSKEIDA